jgi:hypothetical protein
MGTLFNQAVRERHLVTPAEIDKSLSVAIDLAKKHDIDVTDVIAMMGILEERRRNDLYVADRDAFDEQIAGIGEILQNLVGVVMGLSNDRI